MLYENAKSGKIHVMKKQILFLLLFAFISQTANAVSVLTLCNDNSDRKIFASLLRSMGGSTGWQSIGWYGVEAGKCRAIEMGTYDGKVYVHAKDEFNETSWGEGNQVYCIHATEAFKIDNADTSACNGTGQVKVKSDEVAVAEGNATHTFKRNISEINFCNQNTDFSLYVSLAKKQNSSWTSKGWWEVGKGTCRLVSVGKYAGPFQFYAEYNGGDLTWGSGPEKFCVNKTTAFEFQNAENEGMCASNDKKMVKVSTIEVKEGVTKIDFNAMAPKATLELCNKTKDKTLYSAYGVTTASNTIRSIGWYELLMGKCTTIDLGSYQGTGYLYAEADGGTTYWGSGPVNFCTDKKSAFQFEDGGNATLCKADTKNKMVPTSQFQIKSGTNTFSFQ